MSATPPPLPDVPSSAPATSPVYTEAETRDGLAKLKQELETPEKALHLMKSFDKHKVDTSEWKRDPTLAKKDIEKFFPDGDDKKILLNALEKSVGSAEFESARAMIVAIADHLSERQKEIDTAKRSISELNENSLNKVAKEGVSKVFRSVSRASMPEILLWGSAALFLLNHIFKKDDNNTILRPLAIGGIAVFGINALIQHFSPSGKSGIDHLSDLGIKHLPTAQKQLPEQMQALADYANVTNPPELVAMGHLGHESMSHVYSFYKSSRGHGVINPQSLGLSEHQISGARLFQIVDTLVKRHDERKKNGRRVGSDGDFERDFVKGKVPGMNGDPEHNYTFLETCMTLYRDDATSALNYAFSPEKKRAFLERMERDTNHMFEGTAATPLMRDEQMSFYGIKFHYEVPRHEQLDNPQYVYQLKGSQPLTVKLDDGDQKRLEQVGKLKDMAKDYILETVKEKNPSSPVLGTSVRLEYEHGRNRWVFKNVMLKGAPCDVIAKDRADGKLVATVSGRDVEEWSQEKLEAAV